MMRHIPSLSELLLEGTTSVKKAKKLIKKRYTDKHKIAEGFWILAKHQEDEDKGDDIPLAIAMHILKERFDGRRAPNTKLKKALKGNPDGDEVRRYLTIARRWGYVTVPKLHREAKSIGGPNGLNELQDHFQECQTFTENSRVSCDITMGGNHRRCSTSLPNKWPD